MLLIRTRPDMRMGETEPEHQSQAVALVREAPLELSVALTLEQTVRVP